MANSLEKFYRSKVKQMPPVEFLLTADQLKKPPSKKQPQIVRKKVLPPGSIHDFVDKKPMMMMDPSLASPVKALQSSQPVAGTVNFDDISIMVLVFYSWPI